MFKSEEGNKHMPIIKINKNNYEYVIDVEVGKKTKHPNTLEHHIKFIELLFKADNGKLIEIGRSEFLAHGEFESFTEYKARFYFKTKQKGKIIAITYCNIHGLWKNEVNIS